MLKGWVLSNGLRHSLPTNHEATAVAQSLYSANVGVRVLTIALISAGMMSRMAVCRRAVS